MADRILSARTIQIHDTEANWLKAVSFVPRLGEIVVYDIDANHSAERFKIGDGTTLVNDLPFTIDKSIKDFFNSEDEVFYIDGGRISDC